MSPVIRALAKAHEMAELVKEWRNLNSTQGHMAETSVRLGSEAENAADEFLRIEKEIDPFAKS